MPSLSAFLELERCPHCGIDKPTLSTLWRGGKTTTHKNTNQRHWRVYSCGRCGGAILACAVDEAHEATEIYPESETVNSTIPKPAFEYLQQAIDSKNAPAGSVMLCNSSVDAMLKAHGYKDGTIHDRIDKAVADHLLTEEMGKWAHKVRFDSNDPRHADENKPLPTIEDAERSITFSKALGDILFVIPRLIKEELQKSEDMPSTTD